MKIFLLLMSAVSSYSASPFPKAGEAACFRREYTAEHLQKNPLQALSALYVLLKNPRANDEDGYKSAQVVGRKVDGTLFSNRNPGCDYRADGSVFCYVECDGGSFSLSPRADHVLLQVTKDYYFPLFRNGSDPENPGEGDTFSIDGTDKDNAIYKLFQVPVSECQRQLKQIREFSYGC